MILRREPSPDDLLSPADVARQAVVVPATVKTWADKGWLPVIRTAGGRRLFRREDVERFLAVRARKAAA